MKHIFILYWTSRLLKIHFSSIYSVQTLINCSPCFLCYYWIHFFCFFVYNYVQHNCFLVCKKCHGITFFFLYFTIFVHILQLFYAILFYLYLYIHIIYLFNFIPYYPISKFSDPLVPQRSESQFKLKRKTGIYQNHS